MKTKKAGKMSMFSKNGKISEKQLRRMMVLSVFASVIFVVPYLSAAMFGESVVPGLLLFFVFSGLYILYIHGMAIWYDRCKETTGKEGFLSAFVESGPIGITLAIIQLSRIVIRLAFYILLIMEILGEAQVPFVVKSNDEIWSNILVALPLLLVGVYGANNQIEKQGRIHEMLFWFLFLPFIVMLLFGVGEVDYQMFVPRVDMPFRKMLLYGYLLMTFVLPMENYLYLYPALGHQKERNRTAATVIAVVGLSIIITIFMIGIYGLNGAADNPMTSIAIMRYIRLPFGVLERFDVLMIWFFMIGCFVLICQSLYFVGHIFNGIYRNGKKVWCLLLVLALALFLVVFVQTYENAVLTYICYGAMMDIPLSIILPLLGIGLNYCYQKKGQSGDVEKSEESVTLQNRKHE